MLPANENIPALPKRVYHMRAWQRFIGILFLLFGLSFWVAIWTGVLRGEREARFLEMMFPVLFTAFAVVILIRAGHNRVRFSESAIELQTLSARHTLPIEKIRGRRTYFDRGHGEFPDIRHLVLESDDDRHPSLDMEDLYDFDQAFRDWFQSLPDLDAADKSRPPLNNFGLV